MYNKVSWPFYFLFLWLLTWYVAKASGVRPWRSWVFILPPILMICFTASISLAFTACAKGVKPEQYHR